MLQKQTSKSNFSSGFAENLDFGKFETLTNKKMSYLEFLSENDFFEKSVGLICLFCFCFHCIPIFFTLNINIQ